MDREVSSIRVYYGMLHSTWITMYVARNTEGQYCSAGATAPDQSVRDPDREARKQIKKPKDCAVTMRRCIGGSENLTCYKVSLRTDRKRDLNTASDHCNWLRFISVRRGLSTPMRVAVTFSIT